MKIFFVCVTLWFSFLGGNIKKMCCGFAFWKRILVFGLTFALGIFVANFFTSRAASVFCPASRTESPTVAENQRSENASLPDAKNCVPVDGNLKYVQLNAENKLILLEEKRKSDAKKQEATKKFSKDVANKPEEGTVVLEKKPYYPSETEAGVKDLLHREKCFEVREEK